MPADEPSRPTDVPPEQLGTQPGRQSDMELQPKSNKPSHVGSGKLQDKVALITGGDSGIGRAIAIAFAKEGADIAVSYLDEHEDAAATKRLVEALDRRCLTIAGDIGDETLCQSLVKQTVDELGNLDILVNNAAEQHPQKTLEEISAEQLEKTFRTNIFAMFYLAKAALPHLRQRQHSTIINTASVVAYHGNQDLLDYSSTKGAVVSFTRSLALNLATEGIRVNAVAPGPIWTPLIPSTFPPDKVDTFGQDTPMGRPGQPEEVASCFVFLASDDASYLSGQMLHPNGGQVINT